MPKITDNKLKKYAKSPGHCPMCGSDNIEGQSVDIDAEYAVQVVMCGMCEYFWRDQYRLIGIVDDETDEWHDLPLPDVKVYAFVKGGVCQEAISNYKGLTFVVIDQDNEDDEQAERRAKVAEDVARKQCTYPIY